MVSSLSGLVAGTTADKINYSDTDSVLTFIDDTAIGDGAVTVENSGTPADAAAAILKKLSEV